MLLHATRLAFAGFVTLALSLAGAVAAEATKPAESEADATAVEPPTVSRETTYFLGPLDEDGFVDYVAALNRAAPDHGIANEDNAYVGLLEQIDTSDWNAEYRTKHYAALGLPLPEQPPESTFDFDGYAERHGLAEDEDTAQDERPIEDRYRGPPVILSEVQAQRELALEGPWQTTDAPHVAAWLDELEDQLAGISNAVRREGYYCPLVKTQPCDTLLDIVLPHLGKSRSIARALQARAFHRLGQDEINRAIEDIASMERLGRLITRERFLISHLVAISIESLAQQSVKVVLRRPDVTADQIARLRSLRQQLPERDPLVNKVDMERAISLETLTRIARNASAEALDPVNGINLDAMARVGMEPQEWFHLERGLRRVNDTFDRLTDMPERYAEIEPWSESIEASLTEAQVNASGLVALAHLHKQADPGELKEQLRNTVTDAVTNVILSTLTPAMAGAVKTDRHLKAFFELVDLGLALRAYNFDHGRYPDALDALVPDYVEAVPADFATGEPMHYQRKGDGFLLYSVGRDGEDDGGRHDMQDGDIVVQVPGGGG